MCKTISTTNLLSQHKKDVFVTGFLFLFKTNKLFATKVYEGEQLYGSVTVRDIVDVLKKQDISVEKRMVLLKEPIKTLGSFKVPIRVYWFNSWRLT